jgi:hypothetical protein
VKKNVLTSRSHGSKKYQSIYIYLSFICHFHCFVFYTNCYSFRNICSVKFFLQILIAMAKKKICSPFMSHFLSDVDSPFTINNLHRLQNRHLSRVQILQCNVNLKKMQDKLCLITLPLRASNFEIWNALSHKNFGSNFIFKIFYRKHVIIF